MSNDAHVHVDLVHRHGGVDDPVASGDGVSMLDPMSMLPGYVSITMPAQAVAAACGDLLVTRTTMTSGGDYGEFETALDIP